MNKVGVNALLMHQPGLLKTHTLLSSKIKELWCCCACCMLERMSTAVFVHAEMAAKLPSQSLAKAESS